MRPKVAVPAGPLLLIDARLRSGCVYDALAYPDEPAIEALRDMAALVA